MTERIPTTTPDDNDKTIRSPSLEEWQAAFAAAPGCHHPTPSFEKLEDQVGSELVEPLIARLAFDHFEDELQLAAEIDKIIDDSESDEQA